MIRSSNALVLFNKKLLMLLRDDIPTILDPNKRCLHGGCTEKNETPEQTLIRELKEEINVAPKNFKLLGKYIDRNLSEDYLYLVKLDEKEATQVKLGDEGKELRFFFFNELKNIEPTVTLKKLFHVYRKELEHLLMFGSLPYSGKIKPRQDFIFPLA
ncbi:MAG: NUDIX domain-containing protein [bacterium]